MTTRWFRSSTLVAAIAALALGAGNAHAQSEGAKPAPPPATKQEAQPVDEAQERAAIKARLERWLAETKQRQERIEATLKSLNDGASTDAIRQQMEPPRPDRSPNGRPREGQPPRHDGGPPGGNQRGEPRSGLDPLAEREKILEFIKVNNPEMHQRILSALKENPEAGERLFARLVPPIREAIFERDAETRALRIAAIKNGWETWAAGRQLGEATKRGADASEIAAKTTAVRDLLGKQFDIQLQLHEREIASLERRLAELKQEAADSHANRDKFINDRMEMMKRGPRGPRPDDPNKKSDDPSRKKG